MALVDGEPKGPISKATAQKYRTHSSLTQNKYIRGAYNKFPDFFCMGTFIDSTHMKHLSLSK